MTEVGRRVQHLQWGAEALWQQLEPLLPGISIEVVARLDSTNTRLIERVRQFSGQRDAPVTRPGDLADGASAASSASDLLPPYGRRSDDTRACLLVAEEQTRGRGRLGRDWQSTAGLSLTFSLSLLLAPADWSGLSLAVGVALAEALDSGSPTDAPAIGIKWPNDLWLLDAADSGGSQPGRKLGGVLIETVPVAGQRMCVVGVGLNVLPQAHDGLSSGCACLQELLPATSAPLALAQVAAPLAKALRRFEAEGLAPFAAGYARRDLLRGRAVTATGAGGGPLDGTADGIDGRGALRIVADGVHTLVSGDVSVRLQQGSGAC